MKEGTAENLRGQLESATFSHAINGLTSIGQAILEGQKRTEALQERMVAAVERLLAMAGAVPVPEEPEKKSAPIRERVYRTELEITRIVRDAIDLVLKTGWSDRRIAKEIGVDRRVFMSRAPYVSAREKADIYFSRPDPEAHLED